MSSGVAQRVAQAGFLAGLTVIMQLAPGVLPGAGLAVAVFTTLPVYLMMRISPITGLCGTAAAAAVLGIIAPGGALMLLLFMAPIGIVYGWTFGRLRPLGRVLLSTAALTLGIQCLSLIVGVPAFSRLLPQGRMNLALILVSAFAFVFSAAWWALLEQVVTPALHRLPLGRRN